MRAFLSEFTRGLDGAFTVIVMDEDGVEQPRQYRVKPRSLLLSLGAMALGVGLLMVALVVFTPLRRAIPGYGSDDVRQTARMSAMRVAALQDSLAAQQEYMVQLQRLVMGEFEPSAPSETLAASDDPFAALLPEDAPDASGEASAAPQPLSPSAPDWTEPRGAPPAVAAMPGEEEAPFRTASAGARYLSSIPFPVLPPVSGFLTRGFEPRTGHYAVDFAVEAGSLVRSIGDGHVIFADYAHEGGYAIAIQHADGYVSVYKHNQRLVRRTGDRVRARDLIATSGNSGEITSGPHLHFELWHDGRAQDPRSYFVDVRVAKAE